MSPNPLCQGAGGPAGLPAHLSQPAGRSLPAHGPASGRGSGLHVSASLQLRLRLGSRPGRVGAEAGRLGEKREAPENAAGNRTAGRAPAGDHVARGARTSGRCSPSGVSSVSTTTPHPPPQRLQGNCIATWQNSEAARPAWCWSPYHLLWWLNFINAPLHSNRILIPKSSNSPGGR